jgi:hypothetical protein
MGGQAKAGQRVGRRVRRAGSGASTGSLRRIGQAMHGLVVGVLAVARADSTSLLPLSVTFSTPTTRAA